MPNPTDTYVSIPDVEASVKIVSGQHMPVVIDTRVINLMAIRRVVEDVLQNQKMAVMDVAVKGSVCGCASPDLANSYIFLWRHEWEENGYTLTSDSTQSFDATIDKTLGTEFDVFVAKGKSIVQRTHSSAPAEMPHLPGTTTPFSSIPRPLANASAAASTPADVIAAFVVVVASIILFAVKRFSKSRMLKSKMIEPLLVGVISLVTVYIVARVADQEQETSPPKSAASAGRARTNATSHRNLEPDIEPRSKYIQFAPWHEENEVAQATNPKLTKAAAARRSSPPPTSPASTPTPNRVLTLDGSTTSNAQLSITAPPKSVTNNPMYWTAPAHNVRMYPPLPSGKLFTFFSRGATTERMSSSSTTPTTPPAPAGILYTPPAPITYMLRFTNPSARKLFEATHLSKLSRNWRTVEMHVLRTPVVFDTMVAGYNYRELLPPDKIPKDGVDMPTTEWTLTIQARLTPDSGNFEFRCVVYHESSTICFDRDQKPSGQGEADLLAEIQKLGLAVDPETMPRKGCIPRSLAVLDFSGPTKA
jgi:hypothetical protein